MRSQVLRHEQATVCSAHAAIDSVTTVEHPSSLVRIGHWLAWVGLAFQLRRERISLAQLSDHELRDIGLTRAQAEQESYRGIADIPPNRLKRDQPFRRQ